MHREFLSLLSSPSYGGQSTEWNLTAKWLVASIFGWVIGGIGGVEQGNAALDVYLHNTYAVVGHFHFNGLDGIVFAGFGVLYWILPEISSKQWYSKTLGEIHFWASIVGGFGLAFVFTAMGYLGVPRRQYLPFNPGLPFTITLNYQFYLDVALFFALFVAAAQIPFIWNILKTLTGPTSPKPFTTPASLEESMQVPVPMPTPLVRSADLPVARESSGAVSGVSPPNLGMGSGSINQIPKSKEVS